jgi:hypothetical protein
MMTIVYMVAGAALVLVAFGLKQGVVFLLALLVSVIVIAEMAEDRR